MNWNDYFTYDSASGKLGWKRRALHEFKDERSWKIWNTRFAEKECIHIGDSGSGYRMRKVMFRGRLWRQHRIVWEMHNGPITDGLEIDHINGNSLDNRIANLRPVTKFQNMMNMKMPRTNTSGFKGVSRHENKWLVRIKYNGKCHCLGRYDTPEQAGHIYASASRLFHGEYSRLK